VVRNERSRGPDSPRDLTRHSAWPAGQMLNTGLPTGKTGLPFSPFMTPAADVYQATTAVSTPT